MLSDVSPRVAALNRVPTPHLFLGALATYIALAFAAFELFGALSIGVTFFPPAGFTFACLLLLETRRWPAILVAIVAGEMVVDIVEGMSPGWSLAWAAANSAEPVVGAVVARRLAHDVGLNRRFATAFAVGGLVAGPSVGASIGATVLAVSNDFGWIDGFTDVWIGDALGVLVIAPAVILSMLPSRYLVLPSRRAASLAVVAIAEHRALVSVPARGGPAPMRPGGASAADRAHTGRAGPAARPCRRPPARMCRRPACVRDHPTPSGIARADVHRWAHRCTGARRP